MIIGIVIAIPCGRLLIYTSFYYQKDSTAVKYLKQTDGLKFVTILPS